MSASKILTVLKSNVDLAALVSSRIFLSPANQGTKTPFITFEFVSDDPVMDLQGIANLKRQEWDISVISDKYSSSESVIDKVIQSLTGEKVEFRSIFLSSSYEYEQETETHNHTLTFLITY